MKKILVMTVAALFACGTANAQFGGLGKALKDKAKQKVEQVKDKAKEKTKVAEKKDDSSIPVEEDPNMDFGTDEEQQEAAKLVKSPTELDRERRANLINEACKPAYAKVEAALKALEEAVESGNDQYVWDDPAGNDAKRALNECLEIKNFNREDPTFVAFKQRYFNAKENAAQKANLLAERPGGLCHMDRTESSDARLNDFYELMNWYIKAADAAPYARQKEYIVANASKDWKAFEKERLMLFNNTTLTALRKKLDSYRLNIPADKSAKISNKNAVKDPVDLYLLFFSITDYSNNDYSNDANVSPEHKKSMKEAEEMRAQYLREKADVEGLQSIKVTPGGSITCKYGTFHINALNQIYNDRNELMAKMERVGGHYEVRCWPYNSLNGMIYKMKDGTWTTTYFGHTGGRIEKDGTIYFMNQKITQVDLSKISPEWVCMIYFFKALRRE